MTVSKRPVPKTEVGERLRANVRRERTEKQRKGAWLKTFQSRFTRLPRGHRTVLHAEWDVGTRTLILHVISQTSGGYVWIISKPSGRCVDSSDEKYRTEEEAIDTLAERCWGEVMQRCL
jgi:hypothetical protein